MIFNSNKEKFEDVLTKYFSFENKTKSLDPLFDVFHSIKRQDLKTVNQFFKENDEVRKNFSLYLKDLFADKPFNLSLTEANILSENAFFPELKKRTLDKILPPVGNEDSV